MLGILSVFSIIAIISTIIMYILLVFSSKVEERENQKTLLHDFTSQEENPTVDNLVETSQETRSK